MFTEGVWKVYLVKRNSPDALALFEVLKKVEILHVPETVHFKRRHSRNIALGAEITPVKKSLAPFRRTQLPDYLETSNYGEKFC